MSKEDRKIYGIGIVGKGKYKVSTGYNHEHTKQYNVWINMIQRGYDNKFKSANPTYKNCTVCDEWLNFQTFGEWFDNNYIEGCQLDKDLLVKGNKIYSPETCCFLPKSINVLLINNKKIRGVYPVGVTKQRNKFSAHISIKGKPNHIGNYDTIEEAYNAYKKAKEKDISERAEEYKDIISNKAYNALLNYKINEND